jgi:PAS domain S-box-containing protein
MSAPPQTVLTSAGARKGGSLAVSHISLSPLAGEGDRDSRCQVLWADGERVFCRGWRLGEDGSRSAVLIVLPVASHPPPSILDRLAHEYGLKEELNGPWAVRPLEIVRDGGRTMLVLEDISGFEPLEALLTAPVEVGSFLRLAVGIAVAVGKMHQRGLVHKDIKPANILLNRTTGKTKLTGFGIASRLPRHRQAPEPPETIAGTLAYMAPEQTGRMNRSIDARSDLYALGVTLYQMHTGALPFPASDPMDLVHCHVARQPRPPAEMRMEAPAVISAIIMKLLAKTAEERYQTAGGLEADLRRAVAEWESRGRIKAFPLGKRDLPDQLLIPEKLYGREREVETLLAAFDRAVESSAPELVLVTGQAGVGKSTVVHELHRALAAPRGLFASGKFDQYKRDIPYASLAQALLDLIRPLLAKTEAELAPWRAALKAALGVNGALMVTLLPDLELLIGPQPPAPELPPRDAQRRFQLVFRRLLCVFARPEHPLALFLDDLQWLDAATLDLLEDLLSQRDLHHLLLIGAYRDDEVTPTHPLMRRLAAIRKAGGRLHEIVLRPLGVEDVNRIVADALHSDRARPLARLVHEKTAGNPFFVTQFLTALAEEGLLAFDHDAARWIWDLGRIRAKGYTDNVADLMLGKLRRLPATTRTVLKRLACLGASAPIATLALVQDRSEHALHTALGPAVRAGLLLREEGAYRFLHDRVREAAYALIPEGKRPAAHLAIGRRLAAHTPPRAVEETVFEIVGQLNRGAALIRRGEERERLAELNLIAGRRAKSSTAYASALTYLSAGAALLPEEAWERRHDLAFALELNRAECEFLTGALAQALARLAKLSHTGANPSELAILTRLWVDLFMTVGRSDRAVAVGLECLRRFGIAWPEHPTMEEVRDEYDRLWRRLGDRSIEALVDLPPMVDAVACATIDILTSLVTPALFSDENLRCLVIGRMGNLSLEHGNSDASCYAYTAVGNVLALAFGDYEAGFRFAQLGLDLAEQPGMERLRARVYLAFGNLAKPSPRHDRAGRPFARHAFETAQQAGDLTYAAFSCNNLLTQLLAGGAPLADLQREAEAGLEFARSARFALVAALVTAQLALIRTLCGLTPVFGSFNDEGFDEQQFEEQLECEPSLGIAAWMYWIRKLQARLLANDYAAAVAAATKAECLLWMSPAIFERADYHFYAALALAALCETASAVENARYREALAAHHHQLQIWAEYCPENFGSHDALIGAEVARLQSRELDAERLYEEAIRSARGNGFTHHEALANELAARFYEARGFETIAQAYLRNARYCYERWGADGKARQLDKMYPHLREEGQAPSATSTIGAPIEQLDLATVIKVSQAISSEIVADKLIDTIVRIAIEQAGAERGILVLALGDELEIAAEATIVGEAVTVHLRDQPLVQDALPASLLNYVQRTRERVILDDAAAPSQFAQDPYIRQRQTRSVLCLPLLNQAKLVGILYLENNLAPRVFSPSRIAVLKLLASQAATALENTRLYGDLAEREAKIRRLVDANIIGIFTWHIPRKGPEKDEGFFLEVNDAFLRMLGYEREDFAAGRLRRTDLTPPEWRERDIATIAELRESGVSQPFEKEYLAKDGRRVPVLMGAVCFDEARTNGVAFVIDLTERKRTEKELLQSEARLERAQRIARVGWWERNFVTNRVSLSHETSRIFGIDPVDLPEWHDRWLKLIHPDDRPRAAAAALAALSGGPRYDVEYRVVRPDGALRVVHSQGDVTWDESGRPVRQFGVMQDITELRQAEHELRASEARFRTFVDNATDAFILHDDQLTIIDVNRQACASLGYSRDDLIGKHPRIFDVGLDEASVERLRQRAIAGETLTFETRHRRKDGTFFPVEIRTAHIEQGGRRRHLALVRDITERKQAEEQSERLRQLESDLAHLNRLSMMGELTASLAHEILHPIATARNNARAGTRFLDMSPPNLGEVREALECIVRDADRAKDIVGRVRDQIKKAPPRKDWFEINDAIEDVIVMARTAIDKNKILVRTDFMTCGATVEGDRVQLQQVVLNLVLNAIEAMSSVEDGVRELSIRIAQDETRGVLVAVRDSGPGIDQKHFDRVFDPFYTTKTSGVGMGLAICRSIIAAHGGRLWAEANQPRGAIFQFTLPTGQEDS